MGNHPRISMAAARVNAGLTQAAAAELLGVNRSTLVRYESGKTSPDWDVVNKMVDIYEIPIDYLRLS